MAAASSPPPTKVQTTIRARPGKIERLRAAVAGLHDLGYERISLEGALELGVVLAAQALERAHGSGRRFPAPTEPLPRGRRPRR